MNTLGFILLSLFLYIFENFHNKKFFKTFFLKKRIKAQKWNKAAKKWLFSGSSDFVPPHEAALSHRDPMVGQKDCVLAAGLAIQHKAGFFQV